MNENVKTVTIPIDEYFELREKAEMNSYVVDILIRTEARFSELDSRLWRVENAVEARTE